MPRPSRSAIAARAADQHQRAALLHELLHARHGAAPRDARRPGRDPRPARRRARTGRARRRSRARRRWAGSRTSNRSTEIGGVERRRVDHLERELVALEQPPDPSARARAAVAIPQADAHRLQLEPRARGRRRHAGEHQPQIGRGLLEDRPRRAARTSRGDEHRAGRAGRATGAAVGGPVHVVAGAQQAIDGHERVVLMVAHQIAGRRPPRRARRPPAGRSREQDLERAVECLEHAIELHAHLERQRPAGVVVRRHRRPARVGDVVRVLLRLEHVEHVRAERLRRLHHERPGGIALPLHREAARGAMHGDAGLEQRAGELDRGQEIRLVGRQDVAARVALARVAEERARRCRPAGCRCRRHRPSRPPPAAAPASTSRGCRARWRCGPCGRCCRSSVSR